MSVNSGALQGLLIIIIMNIKWESLIQFLGWVFFGENSFELKMFNPKKP